MIKAILFDFDGVLSDSFQNTLGFLSETFTHFGIPLPTHQALAANLGNKLSDLLRELLPQYTEDQLSEIYIYSSEQAVNYAKKIELFPHVIPVLKALQKHHSLAIVTSRSKNAMNVILEKHNLYPYFITIVDREDVVNHKPHPEGIKKALDELAVLPENTVFVGDTLFDSQAAHNAGIISINISKSGKKMNANHVIKDIKDLPALIKTL